MLVWDMVWDMVWETLVQFTRVTKLNNTDIEIDRLTKYRQHTTNASFSWRSVA